MISVTFDKKTDSMIDAGSAVLVLLLKDEEELHRHRKLHIVISVTYCIALS